MSLLFFLIDKYMIILFLSQMFVLLGTDECQTHYSVPSHGTNRHVRGQEKCLNRRLVLTADK